MESDKTKLYIYSKYGVLDAKPMELQAIENSIPEAELKATNQDFEVATETEAVDELVESDEDN